MKPQRAQRGRKSRGFARFENFVVTDIFPFTRAFTTSILRPPLRELVKLRRGNFREFAKRIGDVVEVVVESIPFKAIA